MPSAFVTGATGFVGGALIDRLAASGWETVALVRSNSADSCLNALGVELVYGELESVDTYAGALSGCDIVFHCAGLTGVGHRIDDYERVNCAGTKSLLNAAIDAGVKRFVFVSSVAVYAVNPDTTCYTETQSLPESSGDPYARSKIEAERACLQAHAQGNLSMRIIRPVFVYGPGDRQGGFLPELVAMLRRGRFRLVNRGNNPIPLIYISDLVDSLVLAGDSPQADGQIYNVSSEDTLTWGQFVDLVCRECGLRQPGFISSSLLFIVAGLLEGTARLHLISSLPLTRAAVALLSYPAEFPASKAAEELGFRPKYQFREGLEAALPMLAGMTDKRAS